VGGGGGGRERERKKVKEGRRYDDSVGAIDFVWVFA